MCTVKRKGYKQFALLRIVGSLIINVKNTS